MKFVVRTAEKIFTLLVSVLKPIWIQRALLNAGVHLPYRLAKHLNYTGLVRFTVNGIPLVMRSYNTPIEITIFWRGLFNGREGMELRVWSELVTADSIAFDIGANNGVYALVASAYTKNEVYAFEPVPAVRAMLEENVALSSRSNIVVRSEVVSDTNGQAVLHIPTTDSAWTDVASLESDFVAQRTSASHTYGCPARTVDAVLVELAITKTIPLVCKIDVEGAEAKVLRGMQAALQERPVTLLIELLNEDAFNECKNILPAEYKLFPIASTGLLAKSTARHVVGVKNYVVRKS